MARLAIMLRKEGPGLGPVLTMLFLAGLLPPDS